MPGTTLRRQASRPIAKSKSPAAANKCPTAHLKPVTGGISEPNTRNKALASDASDS